MPSGLCFFAKFSLDMAQIRKVLVGICFTWGWRKLIILTHLSLASLLWDIGKQSSPRCDVAERGAPSGASLFAYRKFIEKLNKNSKSLLMALLM